jgi:hypothetical protein
MVQLLRALHSTLPSDGQAFEALANSDLVVIILCTASSTATVAVAASSEDSLTSAMYDTQVLHGGHGPLCGAA